MIIRNILVSASLICISSSAAGQALSYSTGFVTPNSMEGWVVDFGSWSHVWGDYYVGDYYCGTTATDDLQHATIHRMVDINPAASEHMFSYGFFPIASDKLNLSENFIESGSAVVNDYYNIRLGFSCTGQGTMLSSCKIQYTDSIHSINNEAESEVSFDTGHDEAFYIVKVRNLNNGNGYATLHLNQQKIASIMIPWTSAWDETIQVTAAGGYYHPQTLMPTGGGICLDGVTFR